MGPAVLPRATYRLQLGEGLDLAAAGALVPYLAELGVSHLYLSPVLAARPGSSHGYDVVDPRQVEERLGGEEGLRELARLAAESGMALLLDVVPNHMAIGQDNPFWWDMLAFGREAPGAALFDVDWASGRPDLGGRVLLPLLGRPFGEALAAGEVGLELGEWGPLATHFEHRMPLAPESWPALLGGSENREMAELAVRLGDLPPRQAHAHLLARRAGEARLEERLQAAIAAAAAPAGEESTVARLDDLLARQHWRLAWWRAAGEDLNYRRFFDITDLAAVRVEDPEVFAAVHEKVVELVRDGVVDGLRIDHVDGLRDPEGYLDRLAAVLPRDRRTWVVVEKILSAGEELPRTWRCDGTTGYDFLNSVNGIFVHAGGLATLDEAYRDFTGIRLEFEAVRRGRQRQALGELFATDLSRLVRSLLPLAAEHREARDLPATELAAALAEVTCGMPLYRTYVREGEVRPEDLATIEGVLADAGGRLASRPGAPLALAFLGSVLRLEPPPYLAARRAAWLEWVLSWQQLTGPVVAKGLEDTALYVYNRLLSLNAVGGEPTGVDPPGELAAFHRRNALRAERWPRALLATSTHDSKRSEDVRTRLDVLSELAGEWADLVAEWRAEIEPLRCELAGRTAPDHNEQIFLFQTLLGVWPLDPAELPELAERLSLYLVKALREAKTHSSWLAPDEAWEAAVVACGRELVLGEAGGGFRRTFLPFQAKVAFFGALASLSQSVLAAASPGVRDVYQGTELWDFSLVDPDNRRPVDFASRDRMLREVATRWASGDLAGFEELRAGWRDGRVKLLVTWRALAARREAPEPFGRGEYLPLAASGTRADHVCAFARRAGGEWAVAAASRWLAASTPPGEWPLGAARWGGDLLALPRGAPRRWREALTGREVTAHDGDLAVADLFQELPVALLQSC